MVIQRYIATLAGAGYPEEAATVGTVFSALVHGNFVKLPDLALSVDKY